MQDWPDNFLREWNSKQNLPAAGVRGQSLAHFEDCYNCLQRKHNTAHTATMSSNSSNKDTKKKTNKKKQEDSSLPVFCIPNILDLAALDLQQQQEERRQHHLKQKHVQNSVIQLTNELVGAVMDTQKDPNAPSAGQVLSSIIDKRATKRNEHVKVTANNLAGGLALTSQSLTCGLAVMAAMHQGNEMLVTEQEAGENNFMNNVLLKMLQSPSHKPPAVVVETPPPSKPIKAAVDTPSSEPKAAVDTLATIPKKMLRPANKALSTKPKAAINALAMIPKMTLCPANKGQQRKSSAVPRRKSSAVPRHCHPKCLWLESCNPMAV